MRKKKTSKFICAEEVYPFLRGLHVFFFFWIRVVHVILHKERKKKNLWKKVEKCEKWIINVWHICYRAWFDAPSFLTCMINRRFLNPSIYEAWNHLCRKIIKPLQARGRKRISRKSGSYRLMFVLAFSISVPLSPPPLFLNVNSVNLPLDFMGKVPKEWHRGACY